MTLLLAIISFYLTVTPYYTTSADPIVPEDESVPFLRKCCNNSEMIESSTALCVPTDIVFDPNIAELRDKQVDLYIGMVCKYGKYRLEPDEDKDDEYTLEAGGYLRIPARGNELIHPSDYCLENFKMEDGSVKLLPFVCFPPPQAEPFWKEFTEIAFPIGCLISVPFLIAVMLIYLGIPKLRDTYGKVLGCHVGCLAVAYTSLASVQIFGRSLSQDVCISFAYLIQFSFLSCFFWLNLLCYHTWRKMTKPLKIKIKSERTTCQRMTFILYNFYAMGLPLLILVITLIMDYSPSVPSAYLKPNVGSEACWFQGDKAVIPFFYGPIAILLVVNIIFFSLTARFLHKDSTEKPMEHFGDVVTEVIKIKRKKLFVQCLVLFCGMGLNWILELLSWGIGGPPLLWLFTDLFNTLQGPIIFAIFVYYKKDVCDSLKTQLCSSHNSNHREINREVPLIEQ